MENGRRSDDWNLDEHGFCLLEAGKSWEISALTWETKSKKHGGCIPTDAELGMVAVTWHRHRHAQTASGQDMPMPVAEKDLTQHGFECREHPVLFGFQNDQNGPARPQLLTPEAKDPSFGLDQWLVYYSHVAKAAKKVLPEATPFLQGQRMGNAFSVKGVYNIIYIYICKECYHIGKKTSSKAKLDQVHPCFGLHPSFPKSPRCDLLWSDPDDRCGWGISPRGVPVVAPESLQRKPTETGDFLRSWDLRIFMVSIRVYKFGIVFRDV